MDNPETPHSRVNGTQKKICFLGSTQITSQNLLTQRDKVLFTYVHSFFYIFHWRPSHKTVKSNGKTARNQPAAITATTSEHSRLWRRDIWFCKRKNHFNGSKNSLFARYMFCGFGMIIFIYCFVGNTFLSDKIQNRFWRSCE